MSDGLTVDQEAQAFLFGQRRGAEMRAAMEEAVAQLGAAIQTGLTDLATLETLAGVDATPVRAIMAGHLTGVADELSAWADRLNAGWPTEG